jgi:hypothetical protein
LGSPARGPARPAPAVQPGRTAPRTRALPARTPPPPLCTWSRQLGAPEWHLELRVCTPAQLRPRGEVADMCWRSRAVTCSVHSRLPHLCPPVSTLPAGHPYVASPCPLHQLLPVSRQSSPHRHRSPNPVTPHRRERAMKVNPNCDNSTHPSSSWDPAPCPGDTPARACGTPVMPVSRLAVKRSME